MSEHNISQEDKNYLDELLKGPVGERASDFALKAHAQTCDAINRLPDDESDETMKKAAGVLGGALKSAYLTGYYAAKKGIV